MSVMAGVSDNVISLREKLRGEIRQTKVIRYWPGKAPEWAKEEEEEEEDDVTMHEAVVLNWKDDPRLRRLANTRTDNREQVLADHRRLRQAEIRDDEEDEERRRRIEENNLEREQDKAVEELQDEEEYETDGSEEEVHVLATINPFYVQKTERDTVVERKQLEAKEQSFKELAKRKLEMRKIETKQIVIEEVKKDEERRKNMVYIGDVETDEEINEAEYEVWRTREIARIKRERDARGATLRA